MKSQFKKKTRKILLYFFFVNKCITSLLIELFTQYVCFDTNNHYESNILRIEKYDSAKVWTAVLFDKDQNGYAYVKRFPMEATPRRQNFLGENPDNELLLLTDYSIYNDGDTPLLPEVVSLLDELKG